MAWGHWRQQRLLLSHLESCTTLDAFNQQLKTTGPWVGGFDLPFGLPRELVIQLAWPTEWLACMNHYARLTREQIRDQFAAFCNARPTGGKFAHRATDTPAGSSPSMKWVNPPVAFMMHAGVPLIIAAGLHIPGMHPGDPERVALEAYPGMWARRVLGSRSYKSDTKAKQTPDRFIARKDFIHALVWGHEALPIRIQLSSAQQDVLLADASGDRLDAVVCMMQAAWAQQQQAQGHALFGLPEDMDPLEGWIINA